MSLQANISDTPFNQKSEQPPEKGVLRRHTHTDIQTSNHLQLYDWIGPVVQFSEKKNVTNWKTTQILKDFKLDEVGPVYNRPSTN